MLLKLVKPEKYILYLYDNIFANYEKLKEG